MRRKRIPMWNYSPSKQDRFVFDTNILIRLFHPVDYSSKNEVCEELYASILREKSQLLLSSVQISEYINKCIRLQFDLYKQNNPHASNYQFKQDYRNTRDYKDSMEAILGTIRTDILPYFTTISDGFDAIDPDNIYLSNISYDFNDALLAEIVRAQNAYLVTDDGDFLSYIWDIDVISSNQLLLNCR